MKLSVRLDLTPKPRRFAYPNAQKGIGWEYVWRGRGGNAARGETFGRKEVEGSRI